MSFREYLHEKAEESRHSETLACLVFLAGAVFFIGGILATLSLPDTPQWFLIIPYRPVPDPGMFLSFALLIGGIILIAFGVIAGIHYAKDRSWYIKELHKANSAEESLMYKETLTKNGRRKRNSRA